MGRNLEVFAQISSLNPGPQEAPEIRVESGDERANGDTDIENRHVDMGGRRRVDELRQQH